VIEVFACLAAYYVIGEIGSRKGYGFNGPGLLAAASFPFGEAFGVGMGAMGLLQLFGWSEEPYLALGQYGFTVRRLSYIPVSAELTDPAVFFPIGLGFLALVCIATYYVYVPALSRTVEVSRKSSIPFIPLGILLILSGLFIMGFIGDKGGLVQDWLWRVALFLGVSCFFLQRRARASSAKDVMARDSRAPALYLRAFSGERDFVKTKLPWFAQVVTFEKFLESAINEKIGPFIALGRPEDVLPASGAARDYVPDERWFEVFQDWVGKARCLLVLPSAGTGLEQEIAHISRAGAIDKTFVLIPPPEFGVTDDRVLDVWPKLVAVLCRQGIHIDQIPPEPGQLIAFGPNQSAYVAGRKLETASDYVHAVENIFERGTTPTVEGQGLQLERSREKEAHARAIHDQWFQRGAQVRRMFRGFMGQKATVSLDPSTRLVRWVAIAMFLHGLFNTLLAIAVPSELLPYLLGSSVIVIACAFLLAAFQSRVAAGAAALFYGSEFLTRSPYSFILPWWGDRRQNGLFLVLIAAMFVASVAAFLATIRMRRKYWVAAV
jgi:hypothetical protein